MVFGSPLRSSVPTHHLVLSKTCRDMADRQDVAPRPPANLRARPLRPLHPGDQCWIQDPSTKRWSSIGRVIQAQHRNYTVKMPSGRILWRNRRHIRPYSGDDVQHIQTAAPRSGYSSPRRAIPPIITPAETTEFTPESLEKGT